MRCARLAVLLLLVVGGCANGGAVSRPHARGIQFLAAAPHPMLRPDEAQDVVAAVDRHSTEWTPASRRALDAWIRELTESVPVRRRTDAPRSQPPADDPAAQIATEVDRAHFTDELERTLTPEEATTPAR